MRATFAAFDRGELEAILEYVDPEVVVHDPARTGATFTGHDELLRFWREWLQSWEGYRVEPYEVIEVGERVFIAAEQHARGKTTRVEVGQDLYIVLAIPDDLITEYRIFADRGDAMAAAGLGG